MTLPPCSNSKFWESLGKSSLDHGLSASIAAKKDKFITWMRSQQSRSVMPARREAIASKDITHYFFGEPISPSDKILWTLDGDSNGVLKHVENCHCFYHVCGSKTIQKLLFNGDNR